MSKYIIKNCPAYNNIRKNCGEKPWEDCENITDCAMKKIIEKCITVINDDVCLNCNKFERGLDCYECDYDGHREDICMNRSYVTLAKEILDMLDIEECE